MPAPANESATSRCNDALPLTKKRREEHGAFGSRERLPHEVDQRTGPRLSGNGRSEGKFFCTVVHLLVTRIRRPSRKGRPLPNFFDRWLPAAAFAVAVAAAVPAPAAADEASVWSSAIGASATTALRDALRTETDAQAVPVGQPEPPLSSPSLPQGLTYTLDASMARALGDTGFSNSSPLPGGFDAVVGYAFSKHVRLTAGYYTFQEYPLGFDTGTVPVYAQGLANPVATENLNQLQYNATVDNRIFVAQAQTMIVFDRTFPIVVTPTYLSRSGSIGGGSDLLPLHVNGPGSGYAALVHYRTVQEYLLALTVPILSTPRFFATLTAAPQWDVALTGVQTTNHAQIFELAYLEFRPTKGVTLFVQPSRLVNNLPADQTPQYIPTFIYGIDYKITPWSFAQIAFSTGTPSNRSTLGIRALTLQSPTVTAPTLGGLKASQVQLQIGLGSPSVIPL